MIPDHKIEKALNEARAKIIWGESVDEVRQWLEDWGVPDAQIDELIDETLMERAAEFRKKGVVELIIGGLVLVAPVLILLGLYLADVEASRGVIFLALLCYAALLYGLYRCARGGWWLLRGAKSEGSVTDD